MSKSQLLSRSGRPLNVFSRRQFVRSLAAGGGLAAVRGSALWSAERRNPSIKLGIDNFAVRAMGWDADQLIGYAASQRVDVLFITDLKPFARQDDGYLRELSRKARDQQIEIWLGSWSICPTSRTFKKDWGTAEEHLQLGLRMAKALGSPVFRCVLGSRDDRRSEGGIEARIQDTVRVLKSCRSQAVDSGVKIAIENHAGDMQAWELVRLIEEAGRDFVGANMDPGNATWTLEDPVENLEVLGPYAVCTSMRDSMVWESENGAKVQWTAMGEGNVDWNAYFQKFSQLCPSVPVNIETISGFAVEFPYLKPEFWEVWPKAPAKSFARFIALARSGRELPPHRSANDEEEQAYQRGELERSLEYCRKTLGLGLRPS
jgi:sugar phosphate isomerase/epimerase